MRHCYILAKQKFKALWGQELFAPKLGINQQTKDFQENLILKRVKKGKL